jgi:4-hydroxy-3-methylbut-2-enyl diphosphate reductase
VTSGRPDTPDRGALLVLAPLRIEARAVAAGAPGATVIRAGMGPTRAAATAARLRPGAADHHTAMAVAGVAGALVDALSPGDLVVADRILTAGGDVVAVLPEAAPVAAELARAGLVVHVGAIVGSDHVVRGDGARRQLAAGGAIAVDMESAALLARPWPIPTVVVRAMSDRPGQDLWSPTTIPHGLRALRALRAAGPALMRWAGDAGARRPTVSSPLHPEVH